ncbi:hypothetical protein HPP92_015597 [Vanilla planifolia]|uniref:Uncharacterized protein n=1 Tax=Vanilla planifolia TaxID=51239 RepID=A0A835QDB2_VANPL|nr:hypothetical protein HPP92_015597 [Vanilla planifolia]
MGKGLLDLEKHYAFYVSSCYSVDQLVRAIHWPWSFEVLESSFGYEPYPGFRTNVHAKIEMNRKEWQDRKQKKTT